MNERSYHNQEIVEYLLGSLPAAETERFDELIFTDDEFAGALDDAENELLDRYARGELEGEALAKFKSYYFASPLRREKASFAEAFQIYGKQDDAKKVENSLSADAKLKETRGGLFSFLKFSKNQNLPLRLGFAFAALLLMIAGGFLFLKNRADVETAKQAAPSNVQTEQPKQIEEKESANAKNEIAAANSVSESAAPLPANESPQKKSNARPMRTPEPEKQIAPLKTIVAAFVLSPSLRGDASVKSLSISSQTTEINMKLELETDDFPVFLVALTDETGNVNLWHSGKVNAAGKGENKFLNVRFPAKLLKSKIYSLEVSGVSFEGKTEIIGNYPFRAVLK